MWAITATEVGTNYSVIKMFYQQAIRSIADYSAPLLVTTSPSQTDYIRGSHTVGHVMSLFLEIIEGPNVCKFSYLERAEFSG